MSVEDSRHIGQRPVVARSRSLRVEAEASVVRASVNCAVAERETRHARDAYLRAIHTRYAAGRTRRQSRGSIYAMSRAEWPGGPTPEGRLGILVVDSDSVVHTRLAELLADVGDVVGAHPADALATFDTRPFDVVVVDQAVVERAGLHGRVRMHAALTAARISLAPKTIVERVVEACEELGVGAGLTDGMLVCVLTKAALRPNT